MCRTTRASLCRTTSHQANRHFQTLLPAISKITNVDCCFFDYITFFFFRLIVRLNSVVIFL